MMELLGINPIGLLALMSLVAGNFEFSVDAPTNLEGCAQDLYPAPPKTFVFHRLSLWDGSHVEQEQGETG